MGTDVIFYITFIGNFIFYQDWIETDLLKLFAHPEISEWFSVISVIIFEINIVAEQKQAQVATIFLFFISFHWAQFFYCTPLQLL